MKQDEDYLEVDDVDEICDQLQPAWEKWNEFALHNKITPSVDEPSKAQFRGYALITSALVAIKDEGGYIPTEDIVRALRSIDTDLADRWSLERQGQCIMWCQAHCARLQIRYLS